MMGLGDFMDYTDKQYDFMEMLSDGLVFDYLPEDEQRTLIYLIEKGIAAARAQERDGMYYLSPDGERVLAAHRNELRARELQAQEKAREKAEQERQQRFDNKIAVLNLLMPLITFVLGLIVEHFAGIVGTIARGAQWFIDWFSSLG